MSMKRGRLRAALAATALLFLTGGAVAQEITQSHLQAAIRVSRAAPSVGDLDSLLPFISETVQNRLIRTRPDLFREIATAVEGEAVQLGARRADLTRDVARTWARRFSEDELDRIAEFFGSDLGTKYKELIPEIGDEMVRISRGWSNRVGEELYERSLATLKEQGHEF